MRTWIAFCVVLSLVLFIGGCQAAGEVDFGSEALKAYGIDVAANPEFAAPPDRSSVTLGERHLIVQNYSTMPRSRGLGEAKLRTARS